MERVPRAGEERPRHLEVGGEPGPLLVGVPAERPQGVVLPAVEGEDRGDVDGHRRQSVEPVVHPCRVDGVAGTRFAVWAPNAEAVSVPGDCPFVPADLVAGLRHARTAAGTFSNRRSASGSHSIRSSDDGLRSQS